MANLTDTRYKMQGKTVLYVPNEGSRLSVEEAAKSKEFVQRLESKINNATHNVLLSTNREQKTKYQLTRTVETAREGNRLEHLA